MAEAKPKQLEFVYDEDTEEWVAECGPFGFSVWQRALNLKLSIHIKTQTGTYSWIQEDTFPILHAAQSAAQEWLNEHVASVTETT